MDGIVSQITEYCSCQDIDEKDVVEAIDLVSMYTGWANQPCETFLLGQRKEVIEFPSCHPCTWEFNPFYRPFDPESFTFTLVKQKGLEEMSESVEFVYSEVDENFRLAIPNHCKCGHSCGCNPTYKLVVVYDAGFDAIPDCLLPVFCELVRIIHDKNLCCKDSCGCSSEEENNYQYEDEDLAKSLEETMREILTEQYKRLLGQISLYEHRPGVWGTVI